jgi:hypothetical protein
VTKGCDYAFGRHPDPAKLYAAGFRFAIRYVGGSASKDLTLPEARALRAHGLDVGVVFESSAGRARAGTIAGEQDGRQARAQAEAAGAPPNSAIYYAVDVDTSSRDYPAVDDYGRGFVRGIGPHAAGVYGEYDLVAHQLTTGVVRLGWQTAGWSHHKILRRAGAVLFQGDVSTGQAKSERVDGVDVDVNYALAGYWGGFGQVAQPPHVLNRNPHRQPTRTVAFPASRIPSRSRGAVKQGRAGLMQVGDDVKWVQWAADMPLGHVDGWAGHDTDLAIRAFQRRHRDEHGHVLVVDGMAGAHTIWAMRAVTR